MHGNISGCTVLGEVHPVSAQNKSLTSDLRSDVKGLDSEDHVLILKTLLGSGVGAPDGIPWCRGEGPQ